MKCNQNGCDKEAVFEMVWTKPQQYCTEHAEALIAIGNFIGFPVPSHTIKVLPGMSEAATMDLAESLLKLIGGGDVRRED